MDKVTVVKGVVGKLYTTESSIDQAIADASQLIGEMIKARQELGLTAVTGDAAMQKLTTAVAALADARSAVVEAHSALDDVRLRLGVRTRMVGIIPKTSAESEDEVATLRSVS